MQVPDAVHRNQEASVGLRIDKMKGICSFVVLQNFLFRHYFSFSFCAAARPTATLALASQPIQTIAGGHRIIGTDKALNRAQDDASFLAESARSARLSLGVRGMVHTRPSG